MSLVPRSAAEATRPPAPRRGLGSYLALVFCLLSVLVTAVLVLVSERIASEQVRSSIGSNLAELANQTTSRLDRAMFERYREVSLVAQRLADADLGEVHSEIEAMQRTYPNYAWIGFADPSGRVLAGTKGILVGSDVSARPWFRRSLQGRNVGDAHEAALLTNLLPTEDGELPGLVDIAFPVDRPGQSAPSVLAAQLSWQWARGIENAIFSTLTPGRGVELLIVNSDGLVLLGPKGMQDTQLSLASLSAAAGGSGFTTEPWPDGKDYVVGYSREHGYESYPGLGWRVLVRQELGTAFAPVRQLQRHLVGWGLGVALLFSLVGWLAARSVTRPLKDLAADARELEAGGRLRHPKSEPYREVAELGGSLRSLLRNVQQKEAALRDLNASLERRVEERTAALRETFEHVRESEHRIQTILESAPDPFIAVDLNGCITDWNSRAEAQFGWRREEVTGRSIVDVLIPERFRASSEKSLRLAASSAQVPLGGVVPIERIVIDRSGREIEVEVRVGIVNSGKLQLLCAFMHDISRRKEVERLKTEFVSTVSHELRTPLTAVYGSLRLLAGGVAGQLPAQGKQLLEMSTRSCERLIRLINDVLDVERIASGRLALRPAPLELRDLVARALHDTEAYAHELGVRVRLDEASADHARVVADGDRVTQVVVNLLSNAAKYSPRGDEVLVTLGANEGRARVTVIDHGPGIPPEFRSRLFERFAQADASDRREKGGTGLGLNICRSIVEAHGGTIGFESEPGVRTAFWFELPLEAADATAS